MKGENYLKKKRLTSNVIKKNISNNKIFLNLDIKFFSNKNLKKNKAPIVIINELIAKFPISMARGYNENKTSKIKSNLFLG